MLLLSLPEEILLGITEELGDDFYDGSLQLRLVCHKLESVATSALARRMKRTGRTMLVPHPFRTLRIYPSIDAVSMLESISRHPHLRHLVKRVHIILRPLDLIEIDRPQWAGTYGWDLLGVMTSFTHLDIDQFHEWKSLRRPNDNREHVRYDLYLQNLREQQRILAGKDLSRKFELALASTAFPALSEISLLEQKGLCTTTRGYDGPRGQYAGTLSRKLERVTKSSDLHYSMLNTLLRTMSQRRDIVTLNMHNIDANLLARSGMRQFLKHGGGDLFLHLQSLEIQVHTWEGLDLRSSARNWHRLVTACRNVENFRFFQVPDCDNKHRFGPRLLSSCLNGVILQKLRKFSMAGFHVKTNLLQPFLLSHKSTLKELTLNAIAPVEGDAPNWKAMLKTLRKGLNLEKAELHIYGPHLEQMCDGDLEMTAIAFRWAENVSPIRTHSRSITSLNACCCQEDPGRWTAKSMNDFLVRSANDDDDD